MAASPVMAPNEGSSRRLADIPYDDELRRTFEIYTDDEKAEIEGNLAFVVGHAQRDYSKLYEDALRAVAYQEEQLKEQEKKQSEASVNATNVDHIFQWLTANAPELIPRYHERMNISSQTDVKRALTIPEYGEYATGYWDLLGTATALYDLGRSINEQSFGAGYFAAQMGQAKFDPAVGYALFREQVKAFNDNKDFDYRNRQTVSHVYGQIADLARHQTEYIMDMHRSSDEVPVESDLPGWFYIAGILESVQRGYGLPHARVEPLILEQPIQAMLAFLDERRRAGIQGIPELGEPTLDPESGEFRIGDDVYGYAVTEEDGWEGKPNWLNRPREERKERLRTQQCLIKVTEDVIIGPLDRPDPVYALRKGGIVAFHRLPLSRFRIVADKVSIIRHIPVAVRAQIRLIHHDFQQDRQAIGFWRALRRNTVGDQERNYKNSSQMRKREMEAQARQWIDEKRPELERLRAEFAAMITRIGLGELTDDQAVELLERITVLIGTIHDETEAHVREVTDLTMQLALSERLRYLYGDLSTPKYLQILLYGARLHDIGKIAVPHRDVTHRGCFDNQGQIFRMKAHAPWGQDILIAQPSRLIQASALIAGQHHERLNGTGYPDGLTADQISPGAFLVTVADIWSALSILKEGEPEKTRIYQKEPKPRNVGLRILTSDTEKGDIHPVVVDELFALVNQQKPLTEQEQEYRVRVQGVIRRTFPEVAA